MLVTPCKSVLLHISDDDHGDDDIMMIVGNLWVGDASLWGDLPDHPGRVRHFGHGGLLDWCHTHIGGWTGM